MKKRVLSLLLTLCMLLGLVPTAALAAEEATVDVGGVTLTNGGYYKIDENGAPNIEGTADDYNVHFSNGVLTLKDAAIRVAAGDFGIHSTAALELVLEGKNTISFGSKSDKDEYAGVSVGDETSDLQDLTIRGSGSLGMGAGSESVEVFLYGGAITVKSGTILAEGLLSGIQGASLTVEGGTLTATAVGAISQEIGIGCWLQGDLTISGGTVTAIAPTGYGEYIGVMTDGSVQIKGGSLNVTGMLGIGQTGGGGVNVNDGELTVASNAGAIMGADPDDPPKLTVAQGLAVYEGADADSAAVDSTKDYTTGLATESTYIRVEAAPHSHAYTYTASGAVITGSCTCGHSVTATLTAADATYDGTAKETGSVTYSDGWTGGELTVSYQNNVNAGIATASITCGDATASVDFQITKAIPAKDSYTVPTGLTATEGQTLNDVTLPEGWTWDAPNTSVGNEGENTFAATYTPADTDNYKSVTVNVTVTVSAVHVHSYGGPAWSWTGTTAATATFTCANTDGKCDQVTVTETAAVTSAVTTQKDCTTAEITTYTAKVTFGGTEHTDSKTAQTAEALGHGLAETPAKAATCTEDGSEAYWTCEVCGKHFEDDHGTAEISDLTAWKSGSGKIDAVGHAWGEWMITKAPTMTEAGTAERICTKDSSHKENKGLPVLTDTSVWTLTEEKVPTEGENGSKTYTSEYGDVTITIPALGFGISGTVTDGGSTPLDNTTVTLKQGSTEIATTTTGSDGKYSFTGVAPGQYNVVAAQGGKTMTIFVTVTNDDQPEQDLQMPSENVNSVLEVKGSDTPAVVVGGLDKEAEANKPESSTGNTTVTVTMTVESKTADDALNAEAIKTTAGEDTNLDFLEIKVEKKVETTGGSDAVTTEDITTTQNLLTIVIPFDLPGDPMSWSTAATTARWIN